MALHKHGKLPNQGKGRQGGPVRMKAQKSKGVKVKGGDSPFGFKRGR